MDERQQNVAAAVRALLDERYGKGGQAAIARNTGISEASVSRMLTGKQPITDEILYEVAELLDMPWEQFRLVIGEDLPRANAAGEVGQLVTVRVIDQRASASVRAGVPVEDVTYLTESEMRYAPSNYKGIRIEGDCMDPEIPDGAVVIVELGAPWESGDVVAAEVLRDGNAEVHVKRVRQRGIRYFLVDNKGESLQIEPENVAGVVIKVEWDMRKRKRRR